MNPSPEDALRAPEDAAAMRRAVDSGGRRYQDLRPALEPRFGVVYRDLALGWLVLVGVVAGLVVARAFSPALAGLLVPIGALAVGLALHHLFLFLHEASHYNLARDRARNDRLANALLAPLLGQSVGQYRRIHFDHHRFLGTTRDPERSYFEPLSAGFVLRSLLGVRLVQAGLQRFRHGTAGPGQAAPELGFVAAAAVLHGGLVLISLATGQWPLAIAWAAGVGVVLPFLSSVRQTLEHRSAEARSDVDYAAVDHGETNRLFGEGLLPALVGGAGFNRHLLHHWDPQLSYTRLADLEDFLRDTELAAKLAAQRTTYARTFSQLFGAAR